MKTYEFVFNCTREQAINKILSGTEKPTRFFEDDVFYGEIAKNGKSLYLYRGFGYRNNIKLVFSADIIENGGKTILQGAWKFPKFLKLFICIFSLFLIFVAVSPIVFAGGDGNLLLLYGAVATIVVFACMVFGICIKLGENNRKSVTEYLEVCRKSFETEE